MDYKSILKGMLGQHRIVNEHDLFASSDGFYQVHFTNDGGTDSPTLNTLITNAIELVIVFSDVEYEGLFDESNVEHEDFDLQTALAQRSTWKLTDFSIDADGTMALIFLDAHPDHLKLSSNGEIINPVYEVVPLGSFCDHLIVLLETRNGHQQHIITQNFNHETAFCETDILKIRDGCKVSRFESNDGSSTENHLPFWHLTTYEPVEQKG